MSVEMRGKITKLSDCYCCNLRNDKKIKLYSNKVKNEYINSGINDYLGCEDVDYTRDKMMRSLYPDAKTITSYWHDVCGYDVLVVDGKFAGELQDVNNLLSYAYFTGVSYKDREDLEMKFYEDLDNYDGEIGWWLP